MSNHEDTSQTERDARASAMRDETEALAIALDPMLVSQEFARVPAQIAHATARLAQCEEAYLRAESLYEQTEARAYLQLRADGIGRGDKLTEASLKAMVTTDDLVMTAMSESITARAARDRSRGVLTALLAKKDMLVSIGANQRAEMQAFGGYSGGQRKSAEPSRARDTGEGPGDTGGDFG